MSSNSHNWTFVRPLWRGFAIAPPVTVFAYITIQILISVFDLVEYQGPQDEEYYFTDPIIIALSFMFFSIVAYLNTLLCGLPLIYLLKRYRRLSSLSLMLGATILGSVILPIEMAAAVVLFEGNVSNWSNALLWSTTIGAASGCFTAFVFQIVVGVKNANRVEQTA